MKRVLIHPVKCQNCRQCVVEMQCPMQAIFRENVMEKPWVDFYRCSGCLLCKAVCQNKAIEEIAHPCDGKRRMGW